MSTNFHVLNSLESLKGIPVIRTFDERGGIPSLQITTTEVRNIYIVYQQMIRVMLVKLLLVLIALNTFPATSLEVSTFEKQVCPLL